MQDLSPRFVVEDFNTNQPAIEEAKLEARQSVKKPKLAALSKFLTPVTQPKVESKSPLAQPTPDIQ